VKIYLPNHTEIQLPKQLVKNIQSGITLSQKKDLDLKILTNTDPRTSEDLVSFINISPSSCLFYFIADKPFMEPRKDYDDYTRFINDTYVEEKTDMLNNTCNFEEKRSSFVTKNYNPLMTLRTYSELEARPVTMLNRKGAVTTKNSRVSMNPVERRMGSTFTDFDVRPKILESKISQRDDFFNLSDGFKKIFAADKKD
jgi:hypothetical protein